MDRTTFSK